MTGSPRDSMRENVFYRQQKRAYSMSCVKNYLVVIGDQFQRQDLTIL